MRDNIIYTYTRKQAIADGEQFNVDDFDVTIRSNNNFKIPVFITKGIKKVITQSLELGFNDFNGVLHDILYMLHHKIKIVNTDSDLIKFEVLIYCLNHKHKTFEFYAQISSMDIDNLDPALTVMTKHDL